MGKIIVVDEDVLRASIYDEMRAFVYGSDLEVSWALAGDFLVSAVLGRIGVPYPEEPDTALPSSIVPASSRRDP